MEKAEKKEFYKELLSLAVPLGLQSLLTALVGASDALMLGRWAQDAVSAVSLANQVSFIMMLFCSAVIGSGGVLLAQYWGKGDKDMVRNLLAMMMKWAVCIELVFFALTQIIPTEIMRIFTNDTELIRIGSEYLRIVSFSYLFIGITQCYFTVMKLEGRVKQSVIVSVITLVADMVIDFFLIYGVAGVPKLGANGSAYSTVFVELTALLYCVFTSRSGHNLHPDQAAFRWHSKEITTDLLFWSTFLVTLCSTKYQSYRASIGVR